MPFARGSFAALGSKRSVAGRSICRALPPGSGDGGLLCNSALGARSTDSMVRVAALVLHTLLWSRRIRRRSASNTLKACCRLRYSCYTPPSPFSRELTRRAHRAGICGGRARACGGRNRLGYPTQSPPRSENTKPHQQHPCSSARCTSCALTSESSSLPSVARLANGKAVRSRFIRGVMCSWRRRD
jgi:hypothetical protein